MHIQNVQPSVSYFCNSGICLRKGGALEEKFEDLSLENLNELQLSSSLDLKTFELGKRAVMVEHGVPLLKILVFLFRCRENHGFVRAINFEEYGVVAVSFIFESGRINECLVLVIRKSSVDEMIEHNARVRYWHLLPILQSEDKVFRKRCRKHAPNTVSIKFQWSSYSLQQF